MFAKEIYMSRRERLMKKIDNGLILLLGNSEASSNYPANTYKFRQDSSFLYFFGLNEPDLAAVLDPQSGDQILFGNNVDIENENVKSYFRTACLRIVQLLLSQKGKINELQRKSEPAYKQKRRSSPPPAR